MDILLPAIAAAASEEHCASTSSHHQQQQLWPDEQIRGKRRRRTSRRTTSMKEEALEEHRIQKEQPSWRRHVEARRHSFRRCPPLPSAFPLLMTSLLLSLCLCAQSVDAAGSRANEIDVDWSGVSATSSPTNQQQLADSSQQALVQTKYVRLKDVLRFRCPADLSLAIHLVPADSALVCHLPAEQKDRDRALVGFCGPKSTDPRLILRRYSPLPGKPSFQEGHSYFFISTSDGTPGGTDLASGGLCRHAGLRLRIVVLPGTADGVQSRPADEMVDLARLLFPGGDSKPHASADSATPTSAVMATVDSSFSVFPAILTLEEGGLQRKVLVHSQQELAQQIDLASSNSNQRRGPKDGRLEQLQRPQSHRQQQDAYELMDNGRWPTPHRGSSRRTQQQQHQQDDSSSVEKPAAKSVRSPEPLAENQRLVYIIGYDAHEHGTSALTSSTSTAQTSLLLFLLCFSTLALTFLCCWTC